MTYLHTTFYRFVELSELSRLCEMFKAITSPLEMKGTIHLSSEGINCYVAGTEDAIATFKAFLETFDEFKNLTFKESRSTKIPFNRMIVKVRDQLIPLKTKDEIKPLEMTGRRLAPQELKQWFDENKEFTIIDTRNDYETKLGTFENAKLMPLKHFRYFPEELEKLEKEEKIDKKKPVVMFCTGGIRCEKATAHAKQQGYENVYQLEGGIISYFNEVGGAHWNGECFVFDYRVAIDPQLKETETKVCFSCWEPLTVEDQKSSQFEYGKHCPYCFEKNQQKGA